MLCNHYHYDIDCEIGCVVVCSHSTCKKCRKQLLATLGIFLMHPSIVWYKNYTALGQTCTISLIVEALASYGHLMARCYEGTNKTITLVVQMMDSAMEWTKH